MTTAQYTQLLARLHSVKPTPARDGFVQAHKACCPAHDDRAPSLSVALSADGRILVHCFGGCGSAGVLSAVGFDFSDAGPDLQTSARLAGIGSPSTWGSFSAALNAAEDLVWQHLRGSPGAGGAGFANEALYALSELQRAGRAMMRASASGKGVRHV